MDRDTMAGELADLGARLREEREGARISQRELARRLGVSASLISQIESGQSKPSVSTLYGIVTELASP
jgi:transcriptional regulator with XRE-family HTH domain